MITLWLVIGYIGGSILGILVWVALAGPLGLGITDMVLMAMAFGGVGAGVLVAAGWAATPPAVRRLVHAWKRGYLVVAIGKDRKAHLLPAESDGYLLKPVDEKYGKYRWATDGESLHPVHQGKGLQLAIAYMGASHVIDGVMAAAATRYAELGYETIDDLKTAVELPSKEAVEEEIGRIEDAIATVENMSEEEVEEKYGAPKEQVLGRLTAELRRLERIRDIAEKHGGGPPALNLGGVLVRAADVIKYFAWRTDPNIVDRIVLAETNALLARIGKWRQYAPYMALIAITAIAVIGVLAAVHMLTGGGQPGALPVAQNVSSVVNASVIPVNATG